MKNFIYIILCTITLIIGALLIIQNYFCIETAAQPAVLIANIKSYQSIDAFKKENQNKYDTLIVLENSQLPENDTRPPFSIYRIFLVNYAQLGCKGSLEATFFNNRLQWIGFYPLNYDLYVDTLTATFGESLNMEKEILRDHVRIEIMGPVLEEIYPVEFFIAFIDIRLEHEMEEWIKKYS